MSRYDEAAAIMNERFGNGKDVLISLATIARFPNQDGQPRPSVRNIDAFYEDGVFYAVTHAMSNKMQQIAQNPEIAIDACNEWFTANGIGKNLGWVLDPKNAGIRVKLREAFAAWYDQANNEQDQNCCILEMRLTGGMLIKDHHALRYQIDFVNKSALLSENWGEFK